ncbi:MAG TPA: glycosyltransferase [bacterium]|nr:glycosyltransferase [bacterium]
MNILYVSAKKGWGGVITWMHRTAVGLEARGHKAWILSHPASPFTQLAPTDVTIIPRRLGMDYNPAAILFLATFIKRHHVDVVVTNIQKEVIAGGLAARLCGVPNVRMLGNELDVNDRVKRRQEALVDHTIVPSDSTLMLAKKQAPWLQLARCSTIYAGRDPVAFSEEEITGLRRTWGIPDGALVFGTTARLTRIKGIDQLIEAFGVVAREHPSTYLVVTGEGPERAGLEALASGLGVREHVIFAGFSTEPMKTAAAYDVAVLNSSVEGFPYVIVEYMAAGRPVVATDVGGVREIVRDKENGLLLSAGDRAALIHALVALRTDAAARARLGANALATIRTGFSEAIMCERTERVFEQVVARKAKARGA